MSLFDEPLFIRPFYLPVWIAIRANESLLEQRMCQNRSMSGKSKRFDDRIVSAISASLRKDRDEGSATANRQVTRYRLQRVVSASSADVLFHSSKRLKTSAAFVPPKPKRTADISALAESSANSKPI